MVLTSTLLLWQDQARKNTIINLSKRICSIKREWKPNRCYKCTTESGTSKTRRTRSWKRCQICKNQPKRSYPTKFNPRTLNCRKDFKLRCLYLINRIKWWVCRTFNIMSARVESRNWKADGSVPGKSVWIQQVSLNRGWEMKLDL